MLLFIVFVGGSSESNHGHDDCRGAVKHKIIMIFIIIFNEASVYQIHLQLTEISFFISIYIEF